MAPTLLIHMSRLASGLCSCSLCGSAVAFCSLSTWFSLKHLCALQEASPRQLCFLFNQLNANLDTAEKGPLGLPAGSGGKKKQKKNCLQCRRPRLDPGSGRPPGEGNGNPLQYSCLEHPMERAAWWATVRGVAESDQGIRTAPRS